MKSVYVIGSFQDLETSREVASLFERQGLAALISAPGDPAGIEGCLERIRTADAVYVSNPRGGEIGRSVALDLGYALALGKPVYSMNPVTDPPIGHRIRAVGRELTH